jgi:hypothetical protein
VSLLRSHWDSAALLPVLLAAIGRALADQELRSVMRALGLPEQLRSLLATRALPESLATAGRALLETS